MVKPNSSSCGVRTQLNTPKPDMPISPWRQGIWTKEALPCKALCLRNVPRLWGKPVTYSNHPRHWETPVPASCRRAQRERSSPNEKRRFIPSITGQHSYQHYHRFVSFPTSVSSARKLYKQVKIPWAGHWHAVVTWNCILYQHPPSRACPTNAPKANTVFRVHLLHLIPDVSVLPS